MSMRVIRLSVLFVAILGGASVQAGSLNLMRAFGAGWGDGRHAKRSCTQPGPHAWTEPPIATEMHYPLTSGPEKQQHAAPMPAAPAPQLAPRAPAPHSIVPFVPPPSRGPVAEQTRPALDSQPQPPRDMPILPALQFPPPPPPPISRQPALAPEPQAEAPKTPSQLHPVPEPVRLGG